MDDGLLRILAFGAHPDDCDLVAGGIAACYRSLGHHVRFVSVTNGESGHQRLCGEELAAIRRAEADASAEVLGVEYDILSNRDGSLQPTLAARAEIISIIREFGPDLVLTHRPNDYHPDHRYTSQLVCDAAYMVTVPPVVPEVPALRDNPVIVYFSDPFQKPYPFEPEIVIDIEPVIERVVDMLHCHKSQFYDWLAFNHHFENELPDDDDARREWLGGWYRQRIAPLAKNYRDNIVATYGESQGSRVDWIEAFELCEYGAPLTEEKRLKLFPFLPK